MTLNEHRHADDLDELRWQEYERRRIETENRLCGVYSYNECNIDMFCKCGCGELLPTDRKRRVKYIRGHKSRKHNHPLYKNGKNKYWCKLHNGRLVGEHHAFAEIALGKKLPKGAHVHHFNGDKKDNRNCNLVVCQDSSYHFLLHQRAKAFYETGNPRLRKCRYCHEWDYPENMKKCKDRHIYHAKCSALFQKDYRAKIKITGYEPHEGEDDDH